MRRSGGVDGRNLVEKVGQPHEVFVIRQVQSPHGVVDHLVAYVDFLRQRLFGEAHDRSSEAQIFVKLILRVESEQSLALHAEHRLVFKSDADIGPGVDYALVGDGNNTHRIVDRIVAVFCQGDTSGCDDYRTTGNIHRVQSDCRASRRHIFSDERELVFVGKLPCDHKSRVVKLSVNVIFGDGFVADLFSQMLPERLSHREYDLA